MKIDEIKTELEKVSKFIPELRQDLDQVYASGPGKKSRIKELWKNYGERYKEIKNSKLGKNLQ